MSTTKDKMISVGLASLMALIGMLIGCGLAWWASHQWDTFSTDWLFASCILPMFGAMFGAWLGMPKEDWPPKIIHRIVIALIAGVFAGIGSYIAFAIVALTWNGFVGGIGEFFERLLDPSGLPELSTTKRGYTSTTGAIVHAVICLAVAILLTFFWLKKSDQESSAAIDQSDKK